VSATPILEHLLTRSPEPAEIASIDDWWDRHSEVASSFEAPVDRAMAGAFATDRLGYAFASGFREALRRLLPDTGDARTALCATESGGNRPSAIETALIPEAGGWRMSGDKQWATLGTHAHRLIVLASEGRDARGRNRLAAVLIPADREGVYVEAGPPTPFVPEITHARVRMRDVRVEAAERLPGDGYDRYLKPFRTVEDCHVHAAALAWLLQIARRFAWPHEQSEQLVASITAVRTLAIADPTRPAIHVAFGGLARQLERLLEEAESSWDDVDVDTRNRWQRDRALLQVANSARARRLEVAWQNL